jgi:hypothetical protein
MKSRLRDPLAIGYGRWTVTDVPEGGSTRKGVLAAQGG